MAVPDVTENGGKWGSKVGIDFLGAGDQGVGFWGIGIKSGIQGVGVKCKRMIHK
jgi:hypothetical protein